MNHFEIGDDDIYRNTQVFEELYKFTKLGKGEFTHIAYFDAVWNPYSDTPFDDADKLDYDKENLEVLFMRDPGLHDEYVALSNKKKDQMKFFYIRKFSNPATLIGP